jgi:RNA ligase
MKYDLKEFENRVEDGYIRRIVKFDMIIYNYTEKCTFERAWDQYTMLSRGIVLDKYTGEVIARPFGKFFNLAEMPEITLDKLPVDKGYHVFEKLDGSLGICFFHGGQWHMNTRGSFESEQAVKGLEILNKYRTRYLDKNFTYLFEIIYPENKIVVDYGKEEKLVLLSAFHTKTEREIDPEVLGYVGDQIGTEVAMIHPYSIEEMIGLQKTIPKDQEGFVVRFTNGLRVKIKGDEYMKIAKMLSHMSPISFWEVMKNGVVDRQYLEQLPEEFRKDYEPIVMELEKRYNEVSNEILQDYESLPVHDMKVKGNAKIVGLMIQTDPRKFKHPGAVFPMLNKSWTAVDTYIKRKTRPTGNVMTGV